MAEKYRKISTLNLIWTGWKPLRYADVSLTGADFFSPVWIQPPRSQNDWLCFGVRSSRPDPFFI